MYALHWTQHCTIWYAFNAGLAIWMALTLCTTKFAYPWNGASSFKCIDWTGFYAPSAFVLAGALSAYESRLWLCAVLHFLGTLNTMRAMHAGAAMAHTALYVAGTSSLEMGTALDAALHLLDCFDAGMAI
jgi:hypothetical protein